MTGEDGTVYLNKETQAPIIGAYYFSNQKTWMQVQSGLSVDWCAGCRGRRKADCEAYHGAGVLCGLQRLDAFDGLGCAW